MKQNMASLIWTYREISRTFKFFPSHTNNQFFRCYRPSFNEFEVFLHSTHPNFNYGNFAYLEINLPLKIRKLRLKNWFCTVFWESVFLCVTWKRKEGLVQNWLLKMQNFLFYVISIWYEVPKKKYYKSTRSLLQGKQPQYRLKCHTFLVCDIFELVQKIPFASQMVKDGLKM